MRKNRRRTFCIVLISLSLNTVAIPVLSNEKSWDEKIEAGRRCLKGGDYSSARRFLEEALRDASKSTNDDPRFGTSYFEMGQLQTRLQDYKKARESFELALRAQEKHGCTPRELALTLYGIALCCQQVGMQESAESYFRRVSDIWQKNLPPHDSEWLKVLPSLAAYASLKNDFVAAEAYYRQLTNIARENKDQEQLGTYLNLLASTLGYEGKFDEASDCAFRAYDILKKSSKSSTAIDSAEDNLRIVISSVDERKDIQIAQNNDYAAIKKSLADQLASRQADIARFSAEDPEQPTSPTAIAMGENEDEQTRAFSLIPSGPQSKTPGTGTKSGTPAAAALKPWQSTKIIKKIEHKPATGSRRYMRDGQPISAEEYKALLLANQAFEAAQQAKYVMAAELLNQALVVCPDLQTAHANLGLVLIRLAKPEQAIEHLRIAIALDPSRSAAWVNLSSCFQSTGQLKECCATYNEFLRRFPKDSLAVLARELVKKLQVEVNEQDAVEKVIAKSAYPSSDDYLPYSTVKGTLKWTGSRIPVKVYLPSSESVPGYKSEYEGIMSDSFKAWENASQDKIHFSFVQAENDADISCLWTNDFSKVSSPVEGGEAQVSFNRDGMQKVRIVILTVAPNPDTPLAETQVKAVCLHEIGHSLGLFGHSPLPGDIMYCSMPSSDVQVDLSSRDVSTICKLYSESVRIALKVDPKDKNAVNNEGVELMSSHAYVKAIEKFENALKLDPNYDLAKLNLSIAYSAYATELATKGKNQEALPIIQKAASLQSSIRNVAAKLRSSTLHNYAVILNRLHRAAEAVKIEAQAKALDQQGAH